MSKRLIKFLAVVLISSHAVRGQYPSVPAIVPLHSTRSDVEALMKGRRVLGPNKFDLEEGVVEVRYSINRCIDHGWDVDPDLVLEFSIYPKKEIRIAETTVSHSVITGDDAFLYYTDREKGLQYVVYLGGVIQKVRRVPSESDFSLRCLGFPKYDPATAVYQPYDRITLTGNKWALHQAASALSTIKTRPSNKAYAYVYLEPGISETNGHQIASRLKNLIASALGDQSSRVKITFGGYRDHSEIETFLIPQSWPEPSASPTYPIKRRK